MEKEILFSHAAIQDRVREIAAAISADYGGRELVVVGILKGAFIFMADLVRALDVPCVIDFVRVSSYGAGSDSSGKITVTKDLEMDIAGRDVLVVEDIVDTGITLHALTEMLLRRSPASLRVCAFLDKRARRQVTFEADYVGFTMDDGFVVGYGLDYNEQARFYPDVYVVNSL